MQPLPSSSTSLLCRSSEKHTDHGMKDRALAADSRNFLCTRPPRECVLSHMAPDYAARVGVRRSADETGGDSTTGIDPRR